MTVQVPAAGFVVVSMPGCPYCSLVRSALSQGGHTFVTIDLDTAEERALFKQEHGVPTFPQVFHDGTRIGGYEATRFYLESGSTIPA